MSMVKLDMDLIGLAYAYLTLKHKQSKKEYTVADLFWICHKILQWSERKGKNRRLNPRLQFKNGEIEIDGKLIKKHFSGKG